MTYDASWESLSTHALPQWFDDAKLGVFLHWGLYSVPGWAPQVADIQELLRTAGPHAMLYENPYAEWYLNSMQLEGSPTWKHHRETYGQDFPYDDFREAFDDGADGADLDALAGVARGAGAQYVVLTTKHHEGFTLWPSELAHPVKGNYHARRDLVGDMSQAVRSAGMRMGLYYSGGYDWPFNGAVLKNPADAMLAVPHDDGYAAYAAGHVRELVDRYAPSVLWNDVCWPAGGNLPEVFAHYYNSVPDGVINDRWLEPTGRRSALNDAISRGVGSLTQALWRYLPENSKSLTFPGAHHYDFNTPEYATYDDIVERKWEATRGVGHSFGANRNERPEDIVTATELIRSLCDIVSKNGNLLIGIGPDPSGRISAEQRAPLEGLGAWLSANGEAIYGSRPWVTAHGTTTEGTEVRFTQKDGRVYALLIDLPGAREFALRGVQVPEGSAVRMLEPDQELRAVNTTAGVQVTLPERVPTLATYAIDLGAATSVA